MRKKFAVQAIIVLVVALGLWLPYILAPTPAHAAARTASVSGNWNDTATWGGAAVPGAGDTVTINSGVMVTIPAGYSASATSVTITGATTATQNGITFADATSSLALTAGVTMNAPTASPGSLFAVDAGTLSGATTLSMTGGSTTGRDAIFRISTGTASFSGSTSFSTVARVKVQFTGNGRLNIGGNFATLANVTGGTGIINFNGSTAQTIGSSDGYNNIEINNTSGGVTSVSGGTTIGGALTVTTGTLTINHTFTVTGDTSVSGTLDISNAATFGNITVNSGGTVTASSGTISLQGVTVSSGGTFTAGASSPTVNGAASVSGTLNVSSTTGTKTFVGLVTINSGGTWNNSANEPVTFKGGITNSGTFTAGSGIHTFSTNSQALTGTFSIPSVTVTGVTLTNNGTLTVATSLTGTGGLTNAATGTLNIGDAAADVTTLTATASGNTVNYNGAAQTVKATTYNNLTLSGSLAKTFPTGTTTVNGILSREGTATITLTGTLSYGAAATLQYKGSSAQTTNSEFTSPWVATGGVIIDNASGVILGSARTVNTTLTLTTGTFTITPGLTMGNGATISRANGSLSATPTFGTTVNVTYAGASGSISTGSELPTSSTALSNLTINNSSGVVLGADATVNGTLTLTSGNLTVTNPYVLTMGASATTSGSKDVTGIVKRTSMVAATPYTFGNQYTTVTFDSGGTIPTDFSMKISIGSAPSWKTGAVQRTYDVIRTGGSGTMSMALHYLDAELNGNTETKLVIWDAHLPTPPGDIDEHGRSNYDTTNNWVTLSNLSVTYLATAFDSKVWAVGDSALTPFTWTGATNTNWGYATNWSPDGVPSDQSDVVIPDAATTANDPTLPASATISRLTIESGGILNAAASSTLTIGGASGAWISNGTFNHSTGTVIFTNAAATISGTTDFYNVTIDTGAGLTLEAGNTMRIGGTMTNNGTWNAALLANTVEYHDGGSQTVVNPNGTTPGYYHLNLIEGGTKTLGAGTTVSGTLTIGSGTTLDVSSSNYALAVKGGWSNSGTFTQRSGTVTLSGSSAQAMTGATTFNNLTLNNSSGLTISSNETVNGTLTLTSGNITTGSNSLIIASGGSVSRTSGHIVGNLQKAVSGTGTITFEVGTGSDYAPISANITAVTGTGTLTGSSSSGAHSSISSSGISSNKYVNRYWSLTSTGISSPTYNATFTFVNGDLVGSPTTSSFILRKYSSGTWTRPPGGTSTTGNATTGSSFTAFSDYAIGEPPAWASYESDYSTPKDTYYGASPTVYMRGTGFPDVSYLVAYYDATGTKRGTQTVSASGGTLSSSYDPYTQGGATAGTWHVLVQPSSGYTAFGENSYDTIVAAPDTYGLFANDSFTYDLDDIPPVPEAPTVILMGMGMAGFGIWFWLRRRRLVPES